MSNTNNTPEKKVKAEKNDDMVQAIGAEPETYPGYKKTFSGRSL